MKKPEWKNYMRKWDAFYVIHPGGFYTEIIAPTEERAKEKAAELWPDVKARLIGVREFMSSQKYMMRLRCYIAEGE